MKTSPETYNNFHFDTYIELTKNNKMKILIIEKATRTPRNMYNVESLHVKITLTTYVLYYLEFETYDVRR